MKVVCIDEDMDFLFPKDKILEVEEIKEINGNTMIKLKWFKEFFNKNDFKEVD